MNKLIVSLLFAGCLACHQTGGKAGNNTGKDTTIKTTEAMHVYSDSNVIRQYRLQQQLGDGHNAHKYDAKDVEAAITVMANILKVNHYQPLPAALFDERLKTVFGELYGAGSCRVKQHDKFIVLLEDKGTGEFDYLSNNLVVSLEHRFIMQLSPVAGMVTLTDDTHYTFDDFYNKNVVYRNRYLLNNSAADLAIMLQEDQDWLTILVERFGYTKDPRINGLVLKKYLDAESSNEMEKVSDVLFIKDCNKKLIVRDDLLKWIADSTTADNHHLIGAVEEFMTTLFFDGESRVDFAHPPFSYYTLNEKREIMAHIIAYSMPVYRKFTANGIGDWPGRDAVNLAIGVDEGFVEYVKTKNYFDLPALKQEIDKISH